MGDKGSRDELKDSVSGTEAAPAVARLCYVDDSRTSAYVIRKLLQPYGYQVDYFQSAEPAFVALIQEDYDLLLTDLKVSSKGMDGDDLIRTLRQSGHSKLSSLPVIVITGASDARVLVEVYDAGANLVMSKPVDAEVLNDHILRLLPDSKPDLRVVEQQRDRDNVVSLSAVQQSDQKQTQSEDDTNILTAPKFVSKKENVPKKDKSTVKAKSTVPKKTKATPKTNVTPPPKIKQSDSDIPLLDAESPDQSNAIQGNVKQANQENISKPKAARKPAKKTVENTVDIEKESLLERAVLKQHEQKIVKPDKKPARKSIKDNAVQKTVKPHADLENKKPEKVKAKSPDSVNVTTTPTGKSVEDKNILNDLDQHTLVVGDRSGAFGSSAILDLFTSLVELVGMRSLIQRIVTAVIVIFLVLMAWNILFDEGQPVKTAYVEAGEIFQSITVLGRVLSKQRVNINSEHTGRTVKILVKEGDRVKAGQVLAKMDDRELISRHNRAKANLADAKEGIVVAERTLARLRKAFKKGAVARRFVKDAEVDLSTARSQAGIAVEEAHSANLALSKQRITAPFSGTITAKFAEVGQWVGPSESLFTLVDESRREIEVRVDASDSASIDVGQVVAVTSDAFPGLEWHESVSRLGAAANSDRNSNSVKVYISLGNDAPTLRFGQQVDADIRTAWNPNTLKVPFEALINRDGKTLVAVLREGQVMLKQVEIGIEDFSVVEIKQGLTEGELVILSKGQFLQNGDKVHSVRGNI
jgi:RND family efflux transporter MFP subunit